MLYPLGKGHLAFAEKHFKSEGSSLEKECPTLWKMLQGSDDTLSKLEEDMKKLEENINYERVHRYGIDKYHVKTDWVAKFMVVPAGLAFVYTFHFIMNIFKALVYERHTSVFGFRGEGWFDLFIILYVLDIYGCSSQNPYLFLREII